MLIRGIYGNVETENTFTYKIGSSIMATIGQTHAESIMALFTPCATCSVVIVHAGAPDDAMHHETLLSARRAVSWRRGVARWNDSACAPLGNALPDIALGDVESGNGLAMRAGPLTPQTEQVDLVARFLQTLYRRHDCSFHRGIGCAKM